MSRNTKIILGIVGGVLVLCICAAVIGFVVLGGALTRSVSTNSGDAAATGRQIADYTLPAGWSEQGGMHLLGVSAVFIRMNSSDGLITLMQMPANYKGSEAMLEQQMRRAGGMNMPGQTTEVGRQQATVRGQQTTLTISEGTNSSGRAYRQAMGSFGGKSGTAVLMIVAPIDEWDQRAIDSFLASMR